MSSQIVMTYQFDVIYYLLQKDKQEIKQKERNRIGFKTDNE